MLVAAERRNGSGQVAEKLKAPPASLSFHFKALNMQSCRKYAGWTLHILAANFDVMNGLVDY